MNETTTRERDELAAGRVLRELLGGGEEGREVRERVAGLLYDLRNEVRRAEDEQEALGAVVRFVDDNERADCAFPYTFDRLQALAGSIHHATWIDEQREVRGFAPENQPGDTLSDLIGWGLGLLVGAALRKLGEEMVEGLYYDA